MDKNNVIQNNIDINKTPITFNHVFKIKIEELILQVFIDNSFKTNKSIIQPKIDDFHYHAYFELFFIEDSDFCIVTPTKNYQCNNGLIIIPPFSQHYSFSNNDNFRIAFSISDTTNQNKKNANMIIKFFSNSIKLLNFNPSIKFYFYEIYQHLFVTNSFTIKEITNLLELIFYNICRNNNLIKPSGISGLHQNYLAKIENIIFNNYINPITLSDLSKKLSLSNRQTSRIINSIYNKTYPELILDKKLEVACSLLTTTDFPISQIIEYLNFNSESYFFRTFKNKYNYSPSQYRKNMVKELRDISHL